MLIDMENLALLGLLEKQEAVELGGGLNPRMEHVSEKRPIVSDLRM
jgi:hypothetical protein